MGFIPYSNVNTLSLVTFPNYFTRMVLSSDTSFPSSFLNYKPLWILTLASTLVATTGTESMLAKFFVKVVGSTLSTSPPVISASLPKESMLHSSPSIEMIFTVTPAV